MTPSATRRRRGDHATRPAPIAWWLCLALTIVHLRAAPTWGADPISDDITAEVNSAIEHFQEGRYARAGDVFGQAVKRARAYVPRAEDWVRAAQREIRARDGAKALELAERAVAVDPRSAAARYTRGYVRAQLNRPAAAIEDLREGLRLSPSHPGIADELWEVLSDAHAYGQAISAFEAASKAAPDEVRLQFYLGLARERVGQYDAAMAAFAASIRADPDQPSVHIAVVRMYQEAGLPFDGAIRIYEELRGSAPNATLDFYLARLHLAAGHAEEGRRILDSVATSPDPISAELRQAVAATYGEAKEYGDAVQQMKLASNLMSPKDDRQGEAKFQIGRWSIELGDYESAVRYLEEAHRHHLQTRPDEPIALYFQLGSAYWHKGDKPRAELNFRKFLDRIESIGVRAPDIETLDLLGELYMQDRNYGRAADAYQRIVDVEPNAARARLHLARALLLQGETNSSIHHLQMLREEASVQPDARQELARAFLRDGQAEKAVQTLSELEQSTTVLDQSSAILMAEALLSLRVPSPTQALPYAERASRLDPTDDRAMLVHGEALALGGRRSEARILFEQVYAREATSVRALLGLGDLATLNAGEARSRARVRDVERAISWYEKALVAAAGSPSERATVAQKLTQARAQLLIAESALVSPTELAMGTVIVLLVGAVLVIAVSAWLRTRGAASLAAIKDLERDLKQLLFRELTHKWADAWEEKLKKAPYGERFPVEQLRKRPGAGNILDKANFGHVVVLVELGWASDRLGLVRFLGGAATDYEGARIISCLHFLRASRINLAHSRELVTDEFQAESVASAHEVRYLESIKHMNAEVLRNVAIVRRSFVDRAMP